MLAGSASSASAISLTPGGLLGLFGSSDGSSNSDSNGPETNGFTELLGFSTAGGDAGLLGNLG